MVERACSFNSSSFFLLQTLVKNITAKRWNRSIAGDRIGIKYRNKNAKRILAETKKPLASECAKGFCILEESD